MKTTLPWFLILNGKLFYSVFLDKKVKCDPQTVEVHAIFGDYQ